MESPDVIESAGGVVIATADGGGLHVALVEGMDGKWRLPKGHLLEHESLIEAALREVREEIGLPGTQLSIERYLGGFDLNEFDPTGSDRKINHFFLMRFNGWGLPCLRPDEAHVRAMWARLPARGLLFAYHYQRALLDDLQSNNAH